SNGPNDEDGVTFLSPVLVGQVASISVMASTNGVLNAWLDFSRSGGWADAGEQIFTNTPLVAGTNMLRFVVPLTANPGQTFARFRFNTIGALSFLGEALDGEVEDYLVPLGAAIDLITSLSGPATPVIVGNSISFAVGISNAGPSLATGISVTYTSPPGVIFNSATSSQGVCSESGGVVSCALGNLASNGNATVNLHVTPGMDGALTNLVQIAAAETDVAASNNAVFLVVNAFVVPVISSQPVSLTVTNGDAAAFSVAATGTALGYQWQKDGLDLLGATSATVTLAAVQTNHAGIYRVRVSNPVGVILSTPVTLSVLVPATILVQPQNLARVTGQNAAFVVSASGSEPLVFQWEFELADLAGETNAVLVLTNVQPAQAGLYRVRVANAVRSVTSDSARLTVIEPPAFITQPQGRTNFAGSTATLNASATGTLPLHYQWFFNGTTLLAGETAPVLTLSNLQQSQTGTYTVVVTNSGGAVSSSGALLTVIEADFGDAPQALGYPTTLAFHGAWHRILPGVRLGGAIDFEPDGQPDPAASGDDLATAHDEDGVVFNSSLLLAHSTAVAITASTNGFIDAWIDFDANGSWMESGEQIFDSRPVIAGLNVLNFTVPSDATLGPTFARFRFSTAGGLASDGPAADGEVEDYAVSILPSFDLVVTLTENPNPVLVTSNVTFLVAVTNRGPSVVADVMVTNTLPAGMLFISATPSQGACSIQSGRLVCAIGSLAPSAGAATSVRLLTTRPGVFVSSAVASAPGNDTDLANNIVTQSTAVVVAPVSFASLTAIPVTDATGAGVGLASPYPSTISVSGLTGVVFKITVSLNNVFHTFPGDLDVLLVGPTGEGVMLMSDAGGNIDIQDSTVTFDDDAEAFLPNSGFINTSSYRPTNLGNEPDIFPPPAPAIASAAALSVFRGTDPNGVWSLYVVDDAPSDSGSIGNGWRIEITTAEPIADLGVTMRATPEPAGVSSNLTYAITITNRGQAAATGVRLTDPIPNGALFMSASVPGGSCGVVNQAVLCDIANIDPGTAVLATIVVQASAPGSLTNKASVTGAHVDFVASNNSATVISTVLPVNNLVLTLNAQTNRVVLGGQLNYSLTVTNTGPAAAAHVVLADILPDGVNFISVSSALAACSRSGSVITCDFGALPSGAGGVVQIITEPAAAGLLTNFASVVSDELDSFPGDNSSQIVTPVNRVANLAISVATTPRPVAATSNLLSTITVANSGPSPAVGVRLKSVLPAGVTFVSATGASGGCTNDAGTLRCALGTIGVGQHADVLIVVTPIAPGLLTQLFELESDSFDFASDDNSTLASTPVEQAPIINAGPASQIVLNGSTVTFSVAAIGLNPLGFQWQHDGLDLPNATNTSLILTAVSPLDQGIYRARVANAVGSVLSTGAVLRVLVPPHISDVADITIDEDTATPVMNFSVDDLETPSTALVVTATSSNPLLVPLANILLGGAAGNRTVQVLPATNQSGSALITLRVRDADDAIGSDTFLVTVRPVNDLPLLSAIGDRVTLEDTALNIPFTIGDAETAADALIVTAGATNGSLLPSGTLSLTGSGSNYVLTILPATNQFGTALITVTVTDTNSGATTNSFTLSVVPVNDIPTIGPIADVDVDEDSGTRLILITGLSAGPANEIQALAVSATSANPAIIGHPVVFYTNGLATALLEFTPQTNQSGNVPITVLVNDGGASNNITTRIFVIHVHAINDPPAISDVPAQSTPEDVELTVNLSMDDLETASSDLTLTVTPSNTNLVPRANLRFTGQGATRQLHVLPATNEFGTVTLSVVVRDGDDATASTSIQLTVTPVNDPPTLAPLTNIEVIEGAGLQSVALAGISAGPANEAGPVSVTATSSNPAFISPSVNYSGGSVGSLNFTAAAGATGSVTIIVTVNDGAPLNNTVSRSFVINVIAFDRPPTLSDVAAVITREDEPASVSFGIGDQETPLNALLIAVSSSNTNLVPASALSLSGTGPVRLLRIIPATNSAGSSTITLSVTDTNGGTASRSFLFTATPVNDPPSLSGLANLTTLEDTPITLSGIAVADVDSNPAAVLVTARSSNTNLIADANITVAGVSASRSITIAPAPDQFGTALITVTATDAEGASSVDAFLVTVVPVNDPPTLSPIGNVVVNEDSGIHTAPFTGVSAGPSNESQLLTFTVATSDPALVTALSVSYLHPQATGMVSFATMPDASGTATITVTVDDGATSNRIASRTFTVTVNPVNDAPVISEIAPQSTLEDTARVIAFSVGDDTTPAGNLVLSASSSDTNIVSLAGISFGGSGSNRTITLLPATNSFGASTITVTVTDINNASAAVSFLLTVNSANDPPVLSALADQVVSVPTSQVVVPFTIGDLETPVSGLVVSASSGSPAFLPNINLSFGGSGSNRTLLVNLPATQSGTSTVSVAVKDAGGLSTSRSFVLTVNIPNQPPTLSAPGNLTADEDSAVSVTVTVADAETPVANLAFSATSSNTNLVPANGIAVAASGATRNVILTPLANQTGSTLITLIVTDAAGARATNTFQATFQPVNDSPALNAIANLVTNKNPGTLTINLSGIAAGPGENQTLVISAISSAPLLIPNPAVNYTSPAATGSLILNPVANAVGSAVITVMVDDGAASNNIAVRTFSVTLNPTNYPPAIAPIFARQMDEDTALSVPFTISDADTAAFSLTLSGSSSNTALIANTNIFFDGNGASRSVTLMPSPDQFGVTLITLTVADGAATNSTSFLVTVNPVNDPPALAPIANFLTNSASGNPAYAITIGGITSGAGNESQTLSVTATSTGFLPAPDVTYTSPNTTATLTIRPGNHGTGSSLVTVAVSDNSGSNNVTSRTFLVNVKDPANVPPTISILPAQTIAGNSTLGPLGFTVRDAETAASSLALFVDSSNPSLIPTNNILLGGRGTNRTITLTPAPNQSGVATIFLTVTDPSFGLSNMNFSVTVNPVNAAPTISLIGNQTVSEDTVLGPLLFTVADSDTAVDTLVVTATSSNAALVPAGNILLGGRGANRAIQVTPATNQSGSAIITVRVTDGSATNTTAFTVLVNAANDPPVISDIPDQTIAQDSSTAVLAFTVGDVETAAASLTLGRSSSNISLVPTNSIVFAGSGAARTVVVTPAAGKSGLALITISVTDGAATTTDSFLLTVNPATASSNAAPTLDPIANRDLNQNAGLQTVALGGISAGSVNENQVLVVTAISSNPSLIPAPQITYASPGTSGSLSFTPAPGAGGTATITVSVNDGQAQNSVTTRSFTVTVNAAPTLSFIPDQVSDEDTGVPPIPFTIGDAETAAAALTLVASASDSNLVSTITFTGTGSNRTVVLIPIPNQFGHSLITIKVTDTNGNSTLGGFEWIVNPINDAPTLDPIGNGIVGEDSGIRTINLTGISSGAPNETQTLSVTATSSQPSLIPNPSVAYSSPNATGTLSFAPATNASGVATISVIVRDGQSQNGSVTQSFTVTVTATNDAPVISDIPNQFTSEDVPALVGFTVSDVETAAGALTLSASSSDTNLVPLAGILFGGAGSSRAAIITPAPNRSGTLTLTITVTDAGGASSSDSFLLTVTPVNDAPSLSHIASLAIDQGASTPAINVVIGDTETAPENLNLSVTSSNPALVPLSAILVAGTGSNRTLVVTPANNRSGTALLTLTVTDSEGADSSGTILLTVNPRRVPVAPQLTSIHRIGNSIEISFTTMAGFIYTVEFKNDIGDAAWLSLPTTAGTDGIVTVMDATGIASRRIYRVRAE
ncbi:MAG: large repetitive protein, partial [Verrucomicrobiota bacterium]